MTRLLRALYRPLYARRVARCDAAMAPRHCARPSDHWPRVIAP